MFRNAFAYITRKWSKSLLLLTIILLMSTLSLLGLAMRSATQEAASKSLGSITNSFSMQINRNTNPGTPRGAGNLKGEDIKKISETKGIVSTIKRINGIGDLLDYEIIETEQTLQNQSPERAKNFKSRIVICCISLCKFNFNLTITCIFNITQITIYIHITRIRIIIKS